MVRFASHFLIVLLFVGLLCSSEVKGQSTLFESDEMISVTLSTDFRTLFKDRADDPQQQPATISYVGEDGDTLSQELKVRLRGNFRKKHCNFPPIRLNFAKKEAKGTVFEGEDKLKLVTHCQDYNSKYEQYVLMEYLAYRMYNVLTEKCFKVRLVHITYEDTAKKRKPVTTYGFLIEDEEAMALRNAGTNVELTGYHQEKTEAEHILMLSLFQYMIGNTDWSVPALHNIRLITTKESQLPYAVPYDFDFSGLVNASYANPNPQLDIETVTDRLYRGFCRSEEELASQIAIFQDKKDQFYALIENLEPLSRRSRRSAVSFLDDFYKSTSNEKRIRYAFEFTCRKIEEG